MYITSTMCQTILTCVTLLGIQFVELKLTAHHTDTVIQLYSVYLVMARVHNIYTVRALIVFVYT